MRRSLNVPIAAVLLLGAAVSATAQTPSSPSSPPTRMDSTISSASRAGQKFKVNKLSKGPSNL